MDLPSTDKSDHRYQKTYESFIKWQESNGFIDLFGEDVLLAYFNEASRTLKSSSLWSMYSMLKKTLNRHKNIDISSNKQLTAFLKQKSIGFESKKCKVFSAEEIQRFLVDAPDEHYLAMKTILVFGVTGGCRGLDLTSIKVDYVKDYGSEIIVNIPEPKKNIARLFVINGEYAKFVHKYMQLRPTRVTTDRFFLKYSQGECENQVMGKNKIGIVPKEIAKFLQLDDYKSYTGHSFQSTIHESKRRSTWQSTKIIDHQISPLIPSADDALKRVCDPNNPNTRHSITIKTECEDFYEINDVTDEQQTQLNCESTIPMLPGTRELMKRKSQYYMDMSPTRFLRLLQLAADMNISDVRVMLTLRKLRLNEEYEVLGDLFDMDESTAEKYFHESKHRVIDLVDRLSTATNETTSPIIAVTPTSNHHFHGIFEPIIKIEKCDSPFVADPIAVEAENGDGFDDDDDNDDFQSNDWPAVLPKEDDRGWLADDIRRRTAECPLCHKFYVPRLLNYHMETVHYNLGTLNRTICGLCWKEYATEALLKAHQKDAHGGCSFGCDICGKTFASKRYLSVHILNRHTENKTYLCDTCGEGFPVPFSLQDHVKRKHMERCHDCNLCEMKFVTAAALNDHFVARHTNERRFTCEFNGCGKTFKWRSSFKSHRRVHARDKYECPVCSKQFSFKGNLRNHLKTIHNQIVDNGCLTSKFI